MKLYKTGWRPGQKWCAWFFRLVLDEAGAKEPVTRSGLSQAYINSKSIRAKDVYLGRIKLKVPCGGIYQKGNTFSGHTVIVIKWLTNNRFMTIEGNADNRVKQLTRVLNPFDFNFHLKSFIPIS